MFRETDPMNLPDNLFRAIDEGALFTAGNEGRFNTMTINWGGVGMLWGKPVTTCYIRPHRYTFAFSEQEDYYTLCFFEQKDKETLTYCGSHSGRDVDKISACGLHPVYTEQGVYFEEARLVMVCKKIYIDRFNPDGILDAHALTHYPQNDFHRIYIGEIVKTLIKE